MSVTAAVIPLTPAEIANWDAFRLVEFAVDDKRPLIDEMIAAADHERDRLGQSMMLAHRVYRAPFDQATMRRYVVLRYLIDLLERVSEHKADVTPILFPDLAAPRRRRRA